MDFVGELGNRGYRLIQQVKSSEFCKPRKGSPAAESAGLVLHPCSTTFRLPDLEPSTYSLRGIKVYPPGPTATAQGVISGIDLA